MMNTISTRRFASIPFVDLAPQHEETGEAIREAIHRIIEDAAFVGGEYVQRFEAAFADYCGAAHVVGLSSGTDAVRIALRAVGVRDGSAVVTVSHTFIATAEAVTQLGAVPLFVDIERESQNMSPVALEAFLEESCHVRDDGTVVHVATGRPVTAVLPVHLYGQPAAVGPLEAIASRYDLPLVEDACQAHGAEYEFDDERGWRKAGSLGRVAAFSFYPGKNLGAMGEAGALVTDDAEIAAMARMVRDHGQSEKYRHELVGDNARLDTIQAAALFHKLEHLDRWNEGRRRAAKVYDDVLAGSGLELPTEMPWARHVYHLYVVRSRDRDRLRARAGEEGVATGLHYPEPLHLQPAYAFLGVERGMLPETEAAAAEVLSLPMYPHLDEDRARYAAETLRRLAN